MAKKIKALQYFFKATLLASLVAPLFSCSRGNIVSVSEGSIKSGITQKISQANQVSGQVVVKFRKTVNIPYMEQFARQYNARVRNASARLNSMILEFPQADTNSKLKTLSENPVVEYAEPNYRYSVNFTVNDPKSKEQNGLAVAGLAKAWDITMGDPKLVIAVIDTGADLSHPDLKNKLVKGYNVITRGETPPMDDNGHGTHVSGIAAAQTDNKTGIAGAAPKCRIMPIKVLDERGSSNDLLNIALGIIWAVDNGAKVINLSLGGPDSKTVRKAVEYALYKNVVIVAAMGNDSEKVMKFPAGIPGVISVGSVDFDKSRSSFSNWGEWISVVAPGSMIMSTLPTKEFNMEFEGKSRNYDYLDGTSMASPIVAGVVALMLSRNPQMTPAEVKNKLESTATDLGKTGFDEEYGNGLINAARAVM